MIFALGLLLRRLRNLQDREIERVPRRLETLVVGPCVSEEGDGSTWLVEAQRRTDDEAICAGGQWTMERMEDIEMTRAACATSVGLEDARGGHERGTVRTPLSRSPRASSGQRPDGRRPTRRVGRARRAPGHARLPASMASMVSRSGRDSAVSRIHSSRHVVEQKSIVAPPDVCAIARSRGMYVPHCGSRTSVPPTRSGFRPRTGSGEDEVPPAYQDHPAARQ